MLHLNYVVCFILLHFTAATPYINLYYTDTDWVSQSKSDYALQFNCLRAPASIDENNVRREIISYCMNELSARVHIEENNIFTKFTFAELSKRNITSQQLYYWSAPIDVVENYQFYLNQLSKFTGKSMENEMFYNCTLPRFGSMCQYEISSYKQAHLSLYDIIDDYYSTYDYNPIDMTCYTHLKCNRGPSPACLDWGEICDGQVDCLDGDFDEVYCWNLEINECNEDEYRCRNGQCIPKSFFRDDLAAPDCLDGSDEAPIISTRLSNCITGKPSFGCEDRTCEDIIFTKSCVPQRFKLLLRAMYSIRDESVLNECWSAFKCILDGPDQVNSLCDVTYAPEDYLLIINNSCPDMFYIPNVPILLGQIYIAHMKTDALSIISSSFASPFICFNNSLFTDGFVQYSKVSFNNTACYRRDLLINPSFHSNSWYVKYRVLMHDLYTDLKKYNLLTNYTSEICNKTNMYQCMNSRKCIPVNRLMDTKFDCPQNDDENITHIVSNGLIGRLRSHFKCELLGQYIHQSFLLDQQCHCRVPEYRWCEDENLDIAYARKKISFQTICDGFIELLPIKIKGKNETDETECEHWPCNNIYTRCDGLWNCPNGEDEIDCNFLSILNCSSTHHLCVSPDTYELMCLSIEKGNDGTIDCVGATDEPKLCQAKYDTDFQSNFFCNGSNDKICISSNSLCDQYKYCHYGDDENFCYKNRTEITGGRSICTPSLLMIASSVEKFLCHETRTKKKKQINYFALSRTHTSIEDRTTPLSIPLLLKQTTFVASNEEKLYCHRGINLRVWLNDKNNSTTNTCLCPPSFYGHRCQYQNQRVSLTFKFRALSDSWSTLFAIIVSLIDDTEQRIIHSYEQFSYLSARDCNLKFNIYLLYSTRPKHQTINYRIHIDVYEKLSLKYRASFIFPIMFPFLPIYRFAHVIDIPISNENVLSCSDLECNHGKCSHYSNYKQITSFCRCDEGWSGKYCNFSHKCQCASDSVCLGISADNRSICICPNHKFGPRCLLADTICHKNTSLTCLNNGQCVPADEYTLASDRKFHCICPKGYSGDQCEIVDNEIILTFDKGILVSQSIFVHFIEVIPNASPKRTTTLRTVSMAQDFLTMHWSQAFHLIFIELYEKTYYLAFMKTKYEKSIITMTKTIHSFDRCQHINEIFNETITQLSLIRRIKYYHLPCQIYSSNLSCFYDDSHLCLCYDFENKRLANCFDFNHNMTFDCLGQSVCENKGQCFQDSPDCPKRSICICRPCFYGTRCQFSTNGFVLSLDGILGYHIQPKLSLMSQSGIVKTSAVLTIIFMIAGFINGILALMTFNNKTVCEVGCGLYLLGSSITTLCITVLFGLKFWILIVTQMKYMSNRLFLQIQCRSLDFLLIICVSMDQWLNACVAMERATTIIKATRFRKKKSKQIAKKVISCLLVVIIATCIYDPIYRRLIDEENENEKRTWCIATYSSNLKIFNFIVNIFHFILPFIINLISAIILITKKSHQQSNIESQQTYRQILREQFKQHKHLFTAPIVLVILALPRLIISLVSKCMESTSDSWLFLLGYFISFIPPMLTFLVFIMPSKFYKKELFRSFSMYRKRIQLKVFKSIM